MPVVPTDFSRYCEAYTCTLQAVINHFSGVHLLDSRSTLFCSMPRVKRRYLFRIHAGAVRAHHGRRRGTGAFDLVARFALDGGRAAETNVGVSLVFWGMEHCELCVDAGGSL